MAGGLTACRPEAGRGRSRGAGDVLQDGIRQNDGGIEGRGGGWLCLVEGPYTGTNTPIDERHAARWSPAAIALRESGVVASVCARTGPRRRRVPERVGAARGEAAGTSHVRAGTQSTLRGGWWRARQGRSVAAGPGLGAAAPESRRGGDTRRQGARQAGTSGLRWTQARGAARGEAVLGGTGAARH